MWQIVGEKRTKRYMVLSADRRGDWQYQVRYNIFLLDGFRTQMSSTWKDLAVSPTNVPTLLSRAFIPLDQNIALRQLHRYSVTRFGNRGSMTYTNHKFGERARKRWRICFARSKKLLGLEMIAVLLQDHQMTPSGFLVGRARLHPRR